MKTPAEFEPLLDELLRDGAAFHDALLDRTLQAVRRRREARRLRRILLPPLLLLLVTGLLLWRPWLPDRRAASASASSPATPGSGLIVRTLPPPAAMLVVSTPGAVGVVSSTPTVAVVTTPPMADSIPWVNDSELFGLLAGRPAAIIRPRYGLAELLLLDPAERVGVSGEQ